MFDYGEEKPMRTFEILVVGKKLDLIVKKQFQTEFEQGTVSLTLHRVIWADSSDPVRVFFFQIHDMSDRTVVYGSVIILISSTFLVCLSKRLKTKYKLPTG